jgi:sortase A
MFLGAVLITAGAINFYQIRVLSFSSAPPAAITHTTDLPVEIIIPSLNIDLPIEPGTITKGIWQISSDSATFLLSSALPGTKGNTVIYGHNLKRIFGKLPYIDFGQKITIKTQDGNMYQYKVTDKFLVNPDRVDLVSPTNFEELTIYTCTGFMDSKREVIKAVPIFN